MCPSLQSVQHKLLESLNSQRLSGKFCDVILNVGNASFPIHSCVLASFSPGIFQVDETKALMGSWSFNHPWKLCVRLPKYKGTSRPNVYSEFKEDFVSCSACALGVIEFMYLGKIQIPREHLSHVEALSAYLQISDLILICKNFLSDSGDEFLSLHEPRPVGNSNSNFGMANLNHWSTLDKPRLMPSDNYNSEQSCKGLGLSSTNLKGYCFPYPSKREQEHLKNDMPMIAVSSVLKTHMNCIETVKLNKNPQSCSKCELTFSNSAQLRQHRETHLGKLYSCYTCKYSSQKVIELMKHLIEANHNESVCSLCMYEGENPDMLKQHIELHNDPKPFFCAICNLRFPTRTGLNFHTPKHSTKTPFCCSVCKRGFKWKHNLQSHLVVHTTEKKHLCDQCGFSTAHKSTFNAHELSHTGHTFKCPQAECKFQAVSKRNLIVHLATHTKEKPYQCEICGQSFSQSKNLRRHAVKHDATVDLHHCPMCTFKSIRYDKLKEHFRKHHSNCDENLLPLKNKNVTSVVPEVDVILSKSNDMPLELQNTSLLAPSKSFIVLPVSITNTLTSVAVSDCVTFETQVVNLTTTDNVQPSDKPD